MAQRLIVFDANTLLKLLCHADDGQNIPLDAELRKAGFSPALERYIALQVRSKEWQDPTPLHFRYDHAAQKVMRWQKGMETVVWKEAQPTAVIKATEL